ncbi:MAG: glycosyltransferase family 4 protein, partial [bacterium]|nr:glycosyltransferase family 4 protein [bacterium]
KKIFGIIDKTRFIGHFHITAQGREEFILKQGNKLPFLTKYFEYPIHKLSDRLQVKITEKSIFVSQELFNEAIKYYKADPTKLHVVETGVNTTKFTKEGEKMDFGFEKNSIIIANGGRLSTRKGIDILVNTLKYLPNQYKVVLWGKWDEDMKEIVKKIVKENNLEDRFKSCGAVNYFEIEKYYRSVDYFVLPSSYEGLAKVLLEALYTGNKVITTLFASEIKIPNLYMLQNNTPEQLAKLITDIKDNENKYEQTKQILDQHFSWDAKAKEIEVIYKETIKLLA